MWQRISDAWASVRASLTRRGKNVEAGPGQGLRFHAGRDTERFTGGNYERPVQEAIASLVKPGDVCFDIGANLGFLSLLLARLAGPSGFVYAFEPLAANAAAIRRNARMNAFANLEVVELAVSADDGRAELLVARHVGGAVLDSVGVPPPDLKGRSWVMTASIDSLIERGKVRSPDLVKIDVEGAELDVLRGMERLLRERRPKLLVEVDDADSRACDEKLAACVAFLEKRGFGVSHLPPAYPDTRWFVRHIVATKGAETPR